MDGQAPLKGAATVALGAEIVDIVSRLNREEGVAVLLAEQNATIGQRKSYRDVKHYRRRKRWLS